ncbi:hypothetical protein ACFLVW_07300 [Chloroflexota bacterium]
MYSCPKNALEGKFSVEFCVAIAFIDGKASLEQFTNERVSDPTVQELISKTKYVHLSEFERTQMGEIVVKLRDSQCYARKVERAKGTPQNPLSWGGVSRKYYDCAQSSMPKQEIDHCLEMISKLESIKDITELMNLITFHR